MPPRSPPRRPPSRPPYRPPTKPPIRPPKPKKIFKREREFPDRRFRDDLFLTTGFTEAALGIRRRIKKGDIQRAAEQEFTGLETRGIIQIA